jgi:DNA-directed RNA polymerase specialized sigma24 family protein
MDRDLRELIERLPMREKAITLARLDGASYRSIGERYRISPRGAARIARAAIRAMRYAARMDVAMFWDKSQTEPAVGPREER